MIPAMARGVGSLVNAVPTIDAMSTMGQRLKMWANGSETQKRVSAFLFDDKTDGASSRELNGIAALTFNLGQLDEIMDLLKAALDPEQSSWRTILKGLMLCETMVQHGSEPAVNACMDLDRLVQALLNYNSALASKLHSVRGGGRDEGAPVRSKAAELLPVLGDMDRIRSIRSAARDPGMLVPIGADDYVPSKDGGDAPASSGRQDVFGMGTEDALGANFTLQQVPGVYEGRPDRYFENPDDPRQRISVEDSSHTRNQLAGDLLDLDFSAQTADAAALPEAAYLPAQRENEELQKKLAEMQGMLSAMQQQQQQQQQQHSGMMPMMAQGHQPQMMMGAMPGGMMQNRQQPAMMQQGMPTMGAGMGMGMGMPQAPMQATAPMMGAQQAMVGGAQPAMMGGAQPAMGMAPSPQSQMGSMQPMGRMSVGHMNTSSGGANLALQTPRNSVAQNAQDPFTDLLG